MLMLATTACTTSSVSFFFFNDTATTEIYTLSLHDALPIYSPGGESFAMFVARVGRAFSRILRQHEGKNIVVVARSEEHTSELQSRQYLVCRLLLEKKKLRPPRRGDDLRL